MRITFGSIQIPQQQQQQLNLGSIILHTRSDEHDPDGSTTKLGDILNLKEKYMEFHEKNCINID